MTQKKNLTIDDSISFDKSVDVLNRIFKLGYRGWYKGSCPVGKHGAIVWFPKMAVLKNGRYQAPKKGEHDWINVAYEDGRYIRMYTDDNHLKNDNNWNLIHYTFGKRQDGKYHYIGTYIKRKTPAFPYEARFDRIATSINLDDWDADVVLSDDENLQGEEMEALSAEQLLQVALLHESEKPEIVVSDTPTKSIKRDPVISKFAKVRANGICELCGNDAPFIGRNGEPYLETHHIVPLADGGADTIENTVALCPNCHRRMHQLADTADIEQLKNIHKCQLA